jgi:mannosyltransferase OCH1-like enzyme
MIPKIFHYCRFGGSPLGKNDILCIETWKKNHPDFKFMLWDESIFDFENDFLKDLKELKKWAIYTEYVRYYALQKYGGIYFDTDIVLVKDLGDLLSNDFFIGCEKHDQIGVSAIGSIPNHPVLSELLEYYNNYKSGEEILWSVFITKPVFSKYINVNNIRSVVEFQQNSFIYPPEYFYPLPYENADEIDKYKFNTKNTYTVHLWNASWVDEWRLFWAKRYKTAWKTVFKTLKEKPFQPMPYYKNLAYHALRQIGIINK